MGIIEDNRVDLKRDSGLSLFDKAQVISGSVADVYIVSFCRARR